MYEASKRIRVAEGLRKRFNDHQRWQMMRFCVHWSKLGANHGEMATSAYEQLP